MLPFLLAALWLNLALVLGALSRARANRSLGRAIHRVQAPRTGRTVATLLCLLTGFLAWSQAPTPEEAGVDAHDWPQLFLMLPLLSALALWGQPNSKSSGCGELGAYFGVLCRAYRDVESWRLTGEHLRCQVDGRWYAMPVPVELHPELRVYLEKEAADREHEFNV